MCKTIYPIPKIMGIINATPDSFFLDSSVVSNQEIDLQIQTFYQKM